MIHVIDNYFSDPIAVRQQMLELDYNTSVNEDTYYSGIVDITPYVSHELIHYVQHIKRRPVESYYGHSRFITYEQQSGSWVHCDSHCDVAAMIFMTPDPPDDTGTSFFTHKVRDDLIGRGSDFTDAEFQRESRDITRWTETVRINNIFNRCMIFDTNIYHQARCNGFGTTKEDSRLFQIIFFKLKDQAND